MRAARGACVGGCLLFLLACATQSLELVLQVDPDQALAASVDDAARTARERLRHDGIGYASCRRADAFCFELEGVEPGRLGDARRALAELLGPAWEILDPANGRVPVRMSETAVREARERVVQATIAVLERRARELDSGGWRIPGLWGASKPTVARREGSADRVVVRLPSVSDQGAARRALTTRAALTLKLVQDSGPSEDDLSRSVQGSASDELEVVKGFEQEKSVFYLLRREAVISGSDVTDARAGQQSGRPSVRFRLNSVGAERLKRATAANIGRRLGFVLDGVVVSAPVIQSQISTEAVIVGAFSDQEATNLAGALRAGALPASVKVVE